MPKADFDSVSRQILAYLRCCREHAIAPDDALLSPEALGTIPLLRTVALRVLEVQGYVDGAFAVADGQLTALPAAGMRITDAGICALETDSQGAPMPAILMQNRRKEGNCCAR